jgi:hypothetical protein
MGAVVAVLACSEGAEPGSLPTPAAAAQASREGMSPSARPEIVEMLRESDAEVPDPSDGGGRAWLERDEDQEPYAVSATPDHFTLVYEAGPLGIATGGSIQLQVSPFWNWSTPQVDDPEGRGYTTIEPSDRSIELHAETLDQQLLGLEVTGRPLVEGDRIRIVYGAGPAGAMPDRYAERNSPFWFGVDGDGDGHRVILEDSPTIDVIAGHVAGLLLFVPTIARPGEEFRVTLAFIDAWRNMGLPIKGDVEFVDPPEGIELPKSVRFEGEYGGRRTVTAVAREPGVYRLKARIGELEAESNPLVVTRDGPRVLWGDLHGHSNFSDGTGVPEDYLLYARDVSALDVIALTDHDHWGMLPLVKHPELWDEIVAQTQRFNAPGRFVTILGYEWTSWLHGHRHVLLFESGGVVRSSVDPAYETPTQLWASLEGHDALTFAHHSAGGPIATNWDFAPDPRFEPVTEIVSIHGSSEALDSPNPIYSPVPGNFVRDALGLGYQLGFIGSGDHHDGHPGAYQESPPSGGLAAILSEERTRKGVLEALRARLVYATNGPRILLRTALGPHRMGSIVPVGAGGSLSEELFVRVVAQAPLDRVELVRSGEIVDGVLTEGRLDVTLQRPVEDLRPGEYVYVRAIQENDGMAWSSPIYVTE